MSFLDTLTEAQNDSTSIFLQFLLSTKSYHAFFEGPDDPSFYTGFILSYVSPENLTTYQCSRKAEVYNTRAALAEYLENVEKRQHKVILLFFVDRDLSDLIGEPDNSYTDVFITDYYSIENYIVSEEVVDRLLIELCNTDVKSNTIIKGKFTHELTKFHSQMKIIMAWIIASYRLGEKPVINNLVIDKIFDFDEDLVFLERIDPKFSNLQDAVSKMCKIEFDTNVTQTSLSVIRELDNVNPKRYIRGKYESVFLLLFLQKLNKFFREKMADAGFVLHPPISGEKDVIRILGPRVIIPNSLKFFLETNLQK